MYEIFSHLVSITVPTVLLAGERGLLKWNNDWISFLDTMLQVTILGSTDRSLRLPTRVNNVRIDPQQLINHVSSSGDNHGRLAWIYLIIHSVNLCFIKNHEPEGENIV